MGREWLWTPKPAFLAAWRALPDKEASQVLDKIRLIEADPTLDGKVKKRLTYLNRHVYRLRSGYYRIFYTYSDPYMSLLKLERRRDDTYDDALDAEFLGGFNPDIELSYEETPLEVCMLTTTEPLYLQEPITPELLHNLRVPEQYHPQLLTVRPVPHILFTTYTNALKKSSEQLLAQLLKNNVSCVEGKTVDKIVKDILDGADKPPRIVREDMLAQLIQKSIKQSKFEGSTQQQQIHRQAIERLCHDYLLQEIGQSHCCSSDQYPG